MVTMNDSKAAHGSVDGNATGSSKSGSKNTESDTTNVPPVLETGKEGHKSSGASGLDGKQSKAAANGTKGTRVPYVNLFKMNRMVKNEFKLQFIDTGIGKVNFGVEQIDSVEKTYGICLLGYVISGKPPTVALIDLVRRWGSNIQFQTHESGWIVFSFPSKDTRERILNEGPYMVYGYHLFLKEMPTCFRLWRRT